MGRTWNLVLDVICGALFAVGWWCFVDGISIVDTKYDQTGKFYLYVPGLLSTIGIFILSNVPHDMFKKESSEDHSFWVKALVVFACMCHVAAIIEAFWTFFAKSESDINGDFKWRGSSMIVQSICIAISSFIWQFLYSDE